jgi:hypothetical protein
MDPCNFGASVDTTNAGIRISAPEARGRPKGEVLADARTEIKPTSDAANAGALIHRFTDGSIDKERKSAYENAISSIW